MIARRTMPPGRRLPLRKELPAKLDGALAPMTICIAALCPWTYAADGTTGKAAITASDRQLTAGDIEYEPPQLKVSFQGRHTIIMVAGDYPTHTEALHRVSRILRNTPNLDPQERAEAYAASIRDVKFRQACGLYLAPLGLTSEIFQKNDLCAESILGDLAARVMEYRGENTEAIIVAADDHSAHLYYMDKNAKVNCHDDVGFIAIGLGAWHAKSHLMQILYHNRVPFSGALGVVYTAKKRAELAPGVGVATDMFLLNKLGWEPIADDILAEVSRVYTEFERENVALAERKLKELHDAMLVIAKRQRQADVASPASDAASQPFSSDDRAPAATGRPPDPQASQEPPPAGTPAGTHPQKRPPQSQEPSQ